MIKTSRGGFTFFLFAVGFASAMESAQTRLAFHREKLTEMDVVIAEAIAEKRCPGGVLWIEHEGIRYHKAFGKRAVMPAEEDMTEDTIFDAASLTKVVACLPAVMWLVERGQVKLDERVETARRPLP